jgi:hypothetical protein
LAASWLAALLITGKEPLLGQENSKTVEQVIANYLLAIGGSDRIASNTTFAESGELSGNLIGFGQPFVSPNLRKEKELSSSTLRPQTFVPTCCTGRITRCSQCEAAMELWPGTPVPTASSANQAEAGKRIRMPERM